MKKNRQQPQPNGQGQVPESTSKPLHPHRVAAPGVSSTPLPPVQGRRVEAPVPPHPPARKKRAPKKWYDYLIFVLIGLLLLTAAFFFARPYFIRKNQQKIARELLQLVPSQVENRNEDLQGMYVDADANKVNGESWEVFSDEGPQYEAGEKVFLRPIGRLRIDSIDLSTPILDKAGLVELRYGVGLYNQSAPLFDEKGLSVIFGHHMLEKGHYFNQLPEVKIGDKILVSGNGVEDQYVVDRSLVVQPEDMIPLLTQDSSEKTLLLITCVNPPQFDQRLLVYAKRVERQNHQ